MPPVVKEIKLFEVHLKRKGRGIERGDWKKNDKVKEAALGH
jgi:hypothetical protein